MITNIPRVQDVLIKGQNMRLRRKEILMKKETEMKRIKKNLQKCAQNLNPQELFFSCSSLLFVDVIQP